MMKQMRNNRGCTQMIDFAGTFTYMGSFNLVLLGEFNSFPKHNTANCIVYGARDDYITIKY